MQVISKQADLEKLSHYRDYLRENPSLKFLFFELTDSCNLNCLHCGSECLSSNTRFLEFDLIKKTLDEVAQKYDSSKIWVCITGGEPLLHPKLVEIVKYAHNLGFICGMTSNATLIDEKIAEKLVKAVLESITASIDGLGNSHDKFRGKKDAFSLAMKGIENLRKYGLESEALTVVHKNNIVELDKLYDFFSRNKFYSWRVVNMEPIGRAKLNKEFILDAKELKHLLDFIVQKKRNKNEKMYISYGCSHFLPLEYEKEVRDYYFLCLAGIRVASIMVNGDIAACLDIERRPELIQGNVKTDSFIDVWENKFDFFRKDRTCNSKVCSSCKDKKLCGGDSTHTWNYDLQEPNYCIKRIFQE